MSQTRQVTTYVYQTASKEAAIDTPLLVEEAKLLNDTVWSGGEVVTL